MFTITCIFSFLYYRMNIEYKIIQINVMDHIMYIFLSRLKRLTKFHLSIN
jgi:hypothetical protein